MSLCILAAGKITVLVGATFTLSWTHSVEKTRWEEKWRATSAGLQIVEARIQGSGAGMDPPEGSRFEKGWWVYAPDRKALPRLVLAASGATGEGWTICDNGTCMVFGNAADDPVALRAFNNSIR
ncbi:DUF1850 domain-containing protein [Mesorhizobium sp. WSM4307]|uniref:DUF1850 domain-containing protein n=1 Tax=unclassified Mesorhizobium TaxID=325217 RepID=UPI000BB0405A|nr:MULTISPECIES: DUF1850 domain-containing protein [unclassified Mesorhizobium]PBC19316.1 hypothetical protein CK226_29765 [Mesorhizobium sp. WSM4311]TRC77698.1 DUF1850 domain-containing protein [Mesorhizobium sp. WSM4310]TRC78091.1 DUF1850 domain-containing protein [Mesorhizobium sp. WSM4315]TRC79280.1 DUF1850 domain-containing protein [Mesorhizobium sp. WSM4307]TRD00246.1 DUF1850 domain-containing protein [Mesorhizobium sp. WSM4305]